MNFHGTLIKQYTRQQIGRDSCEWYHKFEQQPDLPSNQHPGVHVLLSSILILSTADQIQLFDWMRWFCSLRATALALKISGVNKITIRGGDCIIIWEFLFLFQHPEKY